MQSIDQLLALVWAHKWLALVALIASYGSTLLSPDSKFPITVSKRARVGLVFGFAFFGATLTSYASSGQDMKTWAATWLLHGALATFLSLGGYAAIVTVVFDGNAPAWLKALALIVPDSGKGPPDGGSPASYRTNAKPPLDDEDKTLPGAERSPLPRGLAVAAVLALVGVVCCVQVNACKQFDTIVHDLTPAAACIVGALSDGGTEDPMVIVSECAGTTIADVIRVIGDLLDNAPDAESPEAGAVGYSPSQRAHLLRVLSNAHRLHAQGVK
jgi:hypothetical protein